MLCSCKKQINKYEFDIFKQTVLFSLLSAIATKFRSYVLVCIFIDNKVYLSIDAFYCHSVKGGHRIYHELTHCFV